MDSWTDLWTKDTLIHRTVETEAEQSAAAAVDPLVQRTVRRMFAVMRRVLDAYPELRTQLANGFAELEEFREREGMGSGGWVLGCGVS